jgi:hypothetical protein
MATMEAGLKATLGNKKALLKINNKALMSGYQLS